MNTKGVKILIFAVGTVNGEDGAFLFSHILEAVLKKLNCR